MGAPIPAKPSSGGPVPPPLNPGMLRVTPNPDREWVFESSEPRFKSVAVITVMAPTYREACAQAELTADAIRETLQRVRLAT